MNEKTIKDILTDAIRYWEPRRIPYNLVLAAITLGWFVYFWPYAEVGILLETLLILFLLAVLANICYCAAYVVDAIVQLSGFRDIWLRRRWGLFILGLLFASAITYFVARALLFHW